MKYCDLPRNSQLCLTIYECCGPGKYVPVGGTTLPLFGKLGVYKQVIFALQCTRINQKNRHFLYLRVFMI